MKIGPTDQAQSNALLQKSNDPINNWLWQFRVLALPNGNKAIPARLYFVDVTVLWPTSG